MRPSMPRLASNPRHEAIARGFFLLVGLGLAILFWKIIEPFALVLITAAVFAIILTPLERMVRKALKRPRLSSALMVLLVLVAIVGPLITAGFVMVNQADGLLNSDLSTWVATFRWEEQPFFQNVPAPLQAQLQSVDLPLLLENIQAWAQEHIGVIFSSSATFLFNTFIFFICLFYFLLERERIVDEALALSPFKDRTDRSIIERMSKTVRAVVLGSLIVAVAQGVMAAIGMTIFGVPGALIWAGLVIIAAQVPMVGTAAVMLPVILYMVLSGHTGEAIGLTAWSVIVVGAIDNVLAPFVVEGKTRMHALLILLSILGGLQLFGPIGFIVGPTVLAAFLALLEMYRAGVLEKTTL